MEKKMHTRSESSGSKTMRAQLQKKAPVKVYPKCLEFKDVVQNFRYQMVIHVRNESKENQKIRILDPIKPYFKIFVESHQMNIAPGLATKIVVLFYLEEPHTFDERDQYTDELLILGNKFKSNVSLIAKRPSFTLSIPKIFNMETIIKNKQVNFQIPLKNKGMQDVEIAYFNSSTPCITFEDQKIIIRKNDTTNMRIKANFKKTGPIQQIIQLPDGECINIKGICIQEKVQIYDRDGKRLRTQDFKTVYIGEKIEFPFYVTNNSPNTIECLAKIFPKTIPDYIDIKINQQKMAFVSRQNPKTLIQEESKINIKCQSTKFHVNPFEDYANKLYLHKTPTEKDLKMFEEDLIEEQNTMSLVKSIFAKAEKQQIMQPITETLFIKVINIEKPLKVVIKYTPIVPKIKMNRNRFQFGQVQPKKNKQMTFTVQNLGQKAIQLKFSQNKMFGIEGKRKIEAFCIQKFTINFRPIILGQYSEIVQLSILENWKTNLRMYGECRSTIIQQCEQNMQKEAQKSKKNVSQSKTTIKQDKQGKQVQEITLSNKKLTDEESKQSQQKKQENNTESQQKKQENKQNDCNMRKSKSSRFLSQQRRKRKQREYQSHLKMKLTERSKMGFYKNNDLPIDLAFDACENPKVKETKKFSIKTIPQGLYLKNDKNSNFTNGTYKKNQSLQNSSRLNIKQAIKCSQQLNIYELSKIEVKGDKLDFGTIFVGSQCQRELIFCNRNSKAIYIELNMNKTELTSDAKGQLKRVEPFGQLKCPVKFKSDHLGQFKTSITYTINKQHIFEIDAIANVTLVNVDFSQRELRYVFTANDLCFEKVQSLDITNQGGIPIKFLIIEPENKSFCVLSKKQQELKSKSSAKIQIAYRPQDTSQSGTQRFDQDKLIIKVIGGAENVVKVFGSVTQPKINIKESEILFTEVFVSMETWGKLTLRNLSKIETVAKIQLQPANLKQAFNFPHDVFAIAPEQRKQIAFSFLSNQPKVLKGTINVMVRGGKNFKIPIYINFVFPLVEVIGMDDIELDTVAVMNNRIEKQIILVNRNKNEIKLQTSLNDFQDHDYMVEFIMAHEGVELGYTYSQNKMKGLGMSRSKANKQMICLEDSAYSTNRRIKDNENVIHRVIYLASGVPTKLKIKFIPKKPQTYHIKVPLILHKACKEIFPIQNMIKCKAVEPLFYIEPYTLNFQNAIISDNEFAHMKMITFVNPHDHQVYWQIEEDSINEIFIFKESEGTLGPNQSRKIEVYFRPIKEGNFRRKILISSGNFYDGFVEVDMIGSAVSPKIVFAKNVLILPIVPLQTESKGTVTVQNEGFQTVNISKWKISQTYPNTEFKVEFLDGKLLSLAKKKLTIEVTFKATAPVSLTTNLELYDEFGEKIEIPISVTAENCAFTTFTYLETFSNSEVIKDKDNKLKLQVGQNLNPCIRKSGTDGSSGISGNFIKKWCSYELNLQFDNFPESFIESKGELFIQLVSRMSNGKNALKKPNFESDDKISRMKELYNFYANAIDTLQSEGAFLNYIRAQHLLNVSDYLLFVMQKNIALEEEQFDDISQQSWTFLFYQLCKIYVESTITDKFVNKMMIKKQKGDGLRSTIYSEHQILILKFLNQFLAEDKVYSFNDQARIFQIIQRIIENTFKISLSQQLANLKINAQSMMLHQFLVIVSKFLHSHLQQLGLSMYLQSNDLFTMEHKEFILFFISLMNSLIHYQNSAVIEFQCAVDEGCRKRIEIENPSKTKNIIYWVKIFGSEAYSCETKSLQLQPKQKLTMQLIYQCQRQQEQEARVLLVPIKDEQGFIPGHCLSFLLKNKIITKNSMKQIRCKAKLYEIKSIFVESELPDNQYTVKLIQRDQDLSKQYSSFYLISETMKVIKGGKDRFELKVAPLKMAQMKCEVVYISPTNQQFTFEVCVRIDLPNVLETIKLPPMTIEKQENAKIVIPYENEKKVQCLKFHKQMKSKVKKKNGIKNMSLVPSNKKNKNLLPIIVETNFSEQSILTTKQPWITLDPSNIDNNFIEIQAFFPKPYRNYTSQLLVKNTEIDDYRVYQVCVSASMKPKYYNLRIKTQARCPIKHIIPNKLWPCFFKASCKLQGVTIDHVGGCSQIMVQYRPNWIQNQEIQLLVEQTQTFQQHIYRIKFEATKPNITQMGDIMGSSIFGTTSQISLELLKLSELQQYIAKTDIQREHKMEIVGKNKVLKLQLGAGGEQMNKIIKLVNKKTDAYYEICISIKNRPFVQLHDMQLCLNIGDIKDYLLHGINFQSHDFKFQLHKQPYLTHYTIYKHTQNDAKGFYIKFMPIKELDQIQQFKFYSQGVDYLIQAHLIAKRVQPSFVNPIITHNIQHKSVNILLTNIYDLQGKYRVQWQDLGSKNSHQRFQVDCCQFYMKSKDKVLIRITFKPLYIGDSCQASLLLKSDILPQLTYIIQGQSKFKCINESLDIETIEPNKFHQTITFINNFNEKDRFRFQIMPSDSDYRFERGGHHFVQEVECKGKVSVGILRVASKDINKKNDKIVISKLKDRRVIRQINLNGLLIKKLDEKQFNWCCKARQTIFQNVKLPNNLILRDIQTAPELLRCISFSSEENEKEDIKIKFMPMKPIKMKKYCLYLITDQVKFIIQCWVKVLPPKPDDAIVIRTDQIREKGAKTFRLTNYLKQSTNFTAYLQNGTSELSVEPSHGLLDAYGKVGTPITVSFMTEIHNKRVQDRLIVQTDEMCWIFRVTGFQSKKLAYLQQKMIQ